MSIDSEIAEALRLLTALDEDRKFNRFKYFSPYPGQVKFFTSGASHRERMLMAGNQVGKTEAGAFEMTCHLTGQYPEWWGGKRFDHPVMAWAAGFTSESVRDIIQTKLCGPFKGGFDSPEFGTGMIPRDLFQGRPSLSRGITDAFDTISVKHFVDDRHDGYSSLTFKSYERGVNKFQGTTLDVGWCDEDPADDAIYPEFLARLVGEGRMFFTATPTKGLTKIVERFYSERHPDRDMVTLSLDDVTHFTEEEKLTRIAGYEEHERECRRRGTPMMGSGRIFPYPDSLVSWPVPDHIPEEWAKIWGIDFGVDHPFAAVLCAWDRDEDVFYVLNGFKISGSAAPMHVQRMKALAPGVPVAWPHDGNQREKGGGAQLASLYRSLGVRMLHEHATHPEGGFGTEGSIRQIDKSMQSGQFKVAAHLTEWFEEFRFYHRKDGLIVRLKDDMLSATRYAHMMRRYARAGNLLGAKKQTPFSPDPYSGIAAGTDFNPWSGT